MFPSISVFPRISVLSSISTKRTNKFQSDTSEDRPDEMPNSWLPLVAIPDQRARGQGNAGTAELDVDGVLGRAWMVDEIRRDQEEQKRRLAATRIQQRDERIFQLKSVLTKERVNHEHVQELLTMVSHATEGKYRYPKSQIVEIIKVDQGYEKLSRWFLREGERPKIKEARERLEEAFKSLAPGSD